MPGEKTLQCPLSCGLGFLLHRSLTEGLKASAMTLFGQEPQAKPGYPGEDS